MQDHGENGPFPAELLVSIFIHLNGQTLATCNQVCRQWNRIIEQFDQVIWPHACRHDFECSTGRTRRFWSLQFPSPSSSSSSFLKTARNKRTWQDMYRMTRNWYTGNVKAFYPLVSAEPCGKACTVIGAPQEQGMFTSLTLAYDGRVVRSNPNYHTPSGSQTIIIQSPQTKQKFFLDSATSSHDNTRSQSIVCHYTDPSSKWLVTGGLNGTVAVWDLTTKKLVRTWQGHRGRVLCISMSGEGT